MRYIKSLLITFIFVLFSCINIQASFSKDDVGSTTAQFLKLGIGAKSAGMGNAVGSVYTATDSIYWNPSNLGYIEKKELSFSHTIWFEDVNYEWLAFALPTTKCGVFGFGLQYVSYGSMDKVDNTNTADGSFSPLDMAVYLSYANNYKRLYFGANLKYIYSKIENSASAVAADLGINYDSEDYRTSFGAAITNLGTKMKFNEEEEDLPLLLKFGVSHFVTLDWLLSLDINFPRDNEFYVNVGTEYYIEIVKDMDLCFRIGYDGRNKDIPGFNWINLGFGLEYLDYKFDYAFVPYGDIGMTHRFSFSIKFGKQIEKEKVDVPIQQSQLQTEQEKFNISTQVQPKSVTMNVNKSVSTSVSTSEQKSDKTEHLKEQSTPIKTSAQKVNISKQQTQKANKQTQVGKK